MRVDWIRAAAMYFLSHIVVSFHGKSTDSHFIVALRDPRIRLLFCENHKKIYMVLKTFGSTLVEHSILLK